ncbi:MAG TPA: PAAR domain-containing protein [Longimicrobium sp.]|nr:PAAR domain-containing protein [Longimicrobium sp.]
MCPFAAKQGDQVVATDIHFIIPPPPATGTIPVPHPFTGIIDGGLSSDVQIEGRPAATVNSTATNTPPHIPIGGTFANPPSNKGTIILGSATVLINGKGAARMGDTVRTCNDPVDQPVGTVIAASTVDIGG